MSVLLTPSRSNPTACLLFCKGIQAHCSFCQRPLSVVPYGFVPAALKKGSYSPSCWYPCILNAAQGPGNNRVWLLRSSSFTAPLPSCLCISCVPSWGVIPIQLWHLASPQELKPPHKANILEAHNSVPAFFPICSVNQNPRLMPVYTMVLMCPKSDLIFPAEWFTKFDSSTGLVKSAVLLKHTCRRKFNCFFYAFDCCWLGMCSCLDTTVLTILAVVHTDWRIPARNVSHRKLKMKPRRGY